MKEQLWEIMEMMAERYDKLINENDVSNNGEIITIQRVGQKIMKIIESEEV